MYYWQDAEFSPFITRPKGRITCFSAQWQPRRGHITYAQPTKCFHFEPWKSEKQKCISNHITSSLKDSSMMPIKVFSVKYKFLLSIKFLE